MIDFDKWQEILATLQRNRLRTFMTAAGVFWGVMMLVIMLGFGRGLEKGVSKNMGGLATNAVYMWSQRTSVPYQGLQPGRHVEFTNDDVEALRRAVPELEYLAPRHQLGGWRGGENVWRNGKTGSFTVAADYPEFNYIQPVVFDKGRFINHLDIVDKRKIAVIGRSVYQELFEPGEDPIGQLVRIQGVYFRVVGLFHSAQSGEQGQRQENTVTVPFTAYQQAFNTGRRVGWFAMTAHADASASVVEEKVKAVLAERHKIAPNDRQAIGSWNTERSFGQLKSTFVGINGLIWFVGIVTLLAGVIGVSNIMLIVVKERTKEIGIRKALGATPASIISQLIQESTALTAVAGYLGLIAGVGLLELAGALIGDDGEFMAPPQIDLNIALIATAILILAGAIAGFMPARAAVRINPVEALRAE